MQKQIKSKPLIAIALIIMSTYGTKAKSLAEEIDRAELANKAEQIVQSANQDRNFLGEENARTLLTMARQHMRHHNYKRAIPLLRQAVQLDGNDADVHALFAAAMQEKLEHQAEKEPTLFNDCVKEWLIVVRNEAGEEKGLTYKGLGFGAGYFQDEERVQEGKRNLKKLTGYLPKPWETDSKYLFRVLRPTDTSVTAIIKKN